MVELCGHSDITNTQCIYAIYCKINNRRYIGCTKVLRSRLQAHLTSLRRGDFPIMDLQKDWDAYLVEDFILVVSQFEIIFFFFLQSVSQ